MLIQFNLFILIAQGPPPVTIVSFTKSTFSLKESSMDEQVWELADCVSLFMSDRRPALTCRWHFMFTIKLTSGVDTSCDYHSKTSKAAWCLTTSTTSALDSSVIMWCLLPLTKKYQIQCSTQICPYYPPKKRRIIRYNVPPPNLSQHFSNELMLYLLGERRNEKLSPSWWMKTRAIHPRPASDWRWIRKWMVCRVVGWEGFAGLG